ncbi:MAG: BlaI/MecI/CopY family transcriptional regulator [Chloroflexota bacterium]|nr:BlaI/MecI/CopY family transcriptional regulator [Chloroflexota bacterium]
MPPRWSPYERMGRSQSGLHKLLGELEVEIMEEMWHRGEATVRDMALVVREKRDAAYTTVMTVMSNLAEKGLLTRTPIDKKTHLYHVALTREEFLAQSSQKMVDTLIHDFGDLALVQFLEAVDDMEPDRLERLRRLLNETRGPQPPEAEESERGVAKE